MPGSIKSFKLSPQSVKQSLPYGDSAEEGTMLSFNQSALSRMSTNQIQ